jgi:hypothetical protein
VSSACCSLTGLADGTQHFMWLLIAAAIAGVATAVLVVIFSDDGNHPTLRAARCSMGFLVAIVWIMAIADEVVGVLQASFPVSGFTDCTDFCADIWIHLWAFGCYHWVDNLCDW